MAASKTSKTKTQPIEPFSNNANSSDEQQIVKQDIIPEIISILDFLPLLDEAGENTPIGELVDLRASAFIRNRNFIMRKFRGMLSADVGDETPETLETIDDQRRTRKLIEDKDLLKKSGRQLYRALGKNFDYYTDTSFQAIELLFSTSELFGGAFDRIKNYDHKVDQHNLKGDISRIVSDSHWENLSKPDLHYNASSIDTATKSGLIGGPPTNNLYRKFTSSVDSLVRHVDHGKFSWAPESLVLFFNGEKNMSTEEVLDAFPPNPDRSRYDPNQERISFLFFMLGKAYARHKNPNQTDVPAWAETVKDIISPKKNSGYNFFREDSVPRLHMGYEEYLTNIFSNTIKNKKTSFDASAIIHIKNMLELYIDAFIQYFYSSAGFFTEHKFINNFYREIGDIMNNIFEDGDIHEVVDDIFIRILKYGKHVDDNLKEIAGYYDNYFRDQTIADGVPTMFLDFNAFTSDIYESNKDGIKYYRDEVADWSLYIGTTTLETARNNSFIFSSVKSLNAKWGDGTEETETCILLIVLNILSFVAKGDYIDLVEDHHVAAVPQLSRYWTNADPDRGFIISDTFDNKNENKTSNPLYDDLRDIYLGCADTHYTILRHVAGLKSIENIFSKVADDLGAIKYLNNEALIAMQPHQHLLLDYNYKHAFKIRQFFDLLQQHNRRFTPQKFNLSKSGSYELLQSYMSQDKCKMNKKNQLDRKKKIFSVGIMDNDIKRAINNSIQVSGNYVIKLKILIEKELAVFDGIKFKPLELEFNLSSFAALNSYEIAGLTNSSDRELLFETTDEIIVSSEFNQFVSNNMKLVKFKNSFTTIEDFMHFDDINDVDETLRNGIESDILKEYIYRVYGIDMSETIFISDRKGPDTASQKIISKTLHNKFPNTQSMLLNKSIFFNGDKFTYEILQQSKFEKIINVLVDVEHDFEVDFDNLELNDLSNVNLLNSYSTADHYDFKVNAEITIEEID